MLLLETTNKKRFRGMLILHLYVYTGWFSNYFLIFHAYNVGKGANHIYFLELEAIWLVPYHKLCILEVASIFVFFEYIARLIRQFFFFFFYTEEKKNFENRCKKMFCVILKTIFYFSDLSGNEITSPTKNWFHGVKSVTKL